MSEDPGTLLKLDAALRGALRLILATDQVVYGDEAEYQRLCDCLTERKRRIVQELREGDLRRIGEAVAYLLEKSPT